MAELHLFRPVTGRIEPTMQLYGALGFSWDGAEHKLMRILINFSLVNCFGKMCYVVFAIMAFVSFDARSARSLRRDTSPLCIRTSGCVWNCGYRLNRLICSANANFSLGIASKRVDVDEKHHLNWRSAGQTLTKGYL